MGNHLRQLQLKNIRITDELFGEYVGKVSETIIPHQWKILNDTLKDADPTYCIRNFRIAAGEAEGRREGVVFQDSDLYKWLETVAYCLASGQGKEYEKLADEVIDLIGRAQEPDGYLNTYFTVEAPDRKWKNLLEGHELYTAGHMIEAAVAYYHATGKKKFLEIARKNADLICQVFGREEGQKRGYPGHQEIELALVKLYRATGKRQYLDTAWYFIDERGRKPHYLMKEMEERGGCEFFAELADCDPEYSQSYIQPALQETAEGHAVRLMYMCSAMADLAEECQDEKLLNACCKIWDNMVQKRMYITGGIGSSGFRERFTVDYDLPNATNYSETCASIGVMMFGQRMASAKKDASYYDTVERALYNTVLAGINREGDRYFYVNPLEVVPEFCTAHTYMDHVKPVRQKWFNVACCPPNVARTLASLGQYIYAENDEAVYIHQFISSQAKTERGEAAAEETQGNEVFHEGERKKGQLVEITMCSQLLQNGKVTIHVKAGRKEKIRIRVPWYAGEGWSLKVNGQLQERKTENGYMTVPCPAGDTKIQIDFKVVPLWMAANDRVRADAGKAALVKGPLVYCLEEADNGKLLSEIYVEENTPVKEEAPAEGLAGGIPVLTYEGVRVTQQEVKDQLYGQWKTKREAVTLKAVPYGLWNNRGQGEMAVWQKVRV